MPNDVMDTVGEPLLEVEDLVIEFAGRRQRGGKRQPLRAVDGVAFTMKPGETVGLAGESGSGKTTLGYAILGRYRPAAGRVRFDGKDLSTLSREELRKHRRNLQMIFQDPYTSLNPRMKVEEIVGEPLIVHGLAKNGSALRTRVRQLMARCGLPPNAADRYPHAFSGGQRQRIGIARALALSPSLIVADEPTSALDVSIQAQIINLLRDLQAESGIAMLFISHNLAVLRQVADRIAIMYMGKVVEIGPTEQVFVAPQHPYTRALLDAIPVPDPAEEWFATHRPLSGDLPSPTAPPQGCRFNTRCPVAHATCFEHEPALFAVQEGHMAACWLLTETPVGISSPRSEPSSAPG